MNFELQHAKIQIIEIFPYLKPQRFAVPISMPAAAAEWLKTAPSS
jgi:hypothetical protein